MAKLVWKGPEVLARVAEASKLGVDKTMSECVSEAKNVHPYEDQTSILTGSVRMNPADIEGLKVSGTWGAYTDYALFIEIGTSRIGPTATQRAQEGEMWSIPDVQPGEGISVQQSFTIVPHGDGEFHTEHRPSVRAGNPGLVAPRPFLRPAQDAKAPLLPVYIALAFSGQKLD